jgi:peptidoglycan/LPS O-acetylase OafA/YrhL
MTDTVARSEPIDAAPPTLAHMPVLDGLRAVAVIAVVLFHTWEGSFPGGFIGVDVFFVISGFLITSLLVGERRATGRVNLPAFWGRRVRRLAPAVVALVVACAVIAHLIGKGSALGLADSIGALTWTQNWVHLAVSTSTWALHDTNTVLDHLWSLAIEEQFYLVWPLVLLAILRFAKRRTTQLIIVLLLIAASATVMGLVNQSAAYFRTDARAFELLGGALLALSGWRPDKRTAHLLAAVGLIAIVVFAFTGNPNDSWLYPWGFLGSTAVFAGLVAASTRPPGWMGVLLGRPAQRIGQVSYGIYLWHIPVIRFLSPSRVHWPAVPLALLRLVVLAAVVMVSYRFIEQPVRSRRWRPTPLRLGVVAVVVVAALIPLGFDARTDFRQQWDAVDMPVGVAPADRVLVVGDGVAALVAKGLPSTTTWDTSQLGCGLLPGAMRQSGRIIHTAVACTHWARRWTDAVDQFRPRVVVVVESTWDLIARADGTPDKELASSVYGRAASILGRHGARVVWIEPFDPSNVSPVPSTERAGRVATANDLSTVLSDVSGVDAFALPSGSAPLDSQQVTAVGFGLARSLQR